MPASIQPLPPEKLRLVSNPDGFSFETTADLEPNEAFIGQPRAARALEFGMGVKKSGYNIFASGPTGTGRTLTIRNFVRSRCNGDPVPDDWVYVFNYETAYRPQPIALPPGQGKALQEAMKEVVATLKTSVPAVIDSYTYRDAARLMDAEQDKARLALLGPLQRRATEQGFRLDETPSGPVVESIDGEAYDRMSPDEQLARRELQLALHNDLEALLRQMRRQDREAYERRKEMDRETMSVTLDEAFLPAETEFADNERVLAYLAAAKKDLLENIIGAATAIEEKGLEEVVDLQRYEVNLFVDNSETEGAPVRVQKSATLENLFGRLEYDAQGNVMATHFTRLKPGDLHMANGGYLILNGLELMRNRDTLDALTQTLRTEEIEMRPPRSDSSSMSNTLWPEPIPLNMKIILVGSDHLYYHLTQDEEFEKLFKVRADFSDYMPRDEVHELDYARFVAGRCKEDGLRPFDRTAVARIIEYGARMAEHQNKLSAHFGTIADLIREADYWAGCSGREIVTGRDVQKALDERFDRQGYYAEREQERMVEGSVFIATEGAVVGQINGLSVMGDGEYAYGGPDRITARTYIGESGVIHIEREVDMDGPIHSKGVLTLGGYLGGTYAQHQPLSLSASLTFEQSYGGVEGDSASSTELYALLSSLSQIPIRQGIAVTGSVNQHGEVQPIGSVNEKIEGFFKLCSARGLTGEQGVIIPANNASRLMLSDAVIEAVAAGTFHIWAVEHVDQGIELLTGVPAGTPDADGEFPEGTIHHAVKKRLYELAMELKGFGDQRDDAEEEDD